MTLPLEGIKILDSAHQYPGPYCSMLLGDLGAEVIKVEQPKTGDPARANPGFFKGINRNKKSITLDLKKPSAGEIMKRLVREADVFTEGFRPGVVKRLGVDYETLKKINPRLIYCSISGYGQNGPYRDLPGHDLNYMAMAGMLDSIRDKDGTHVSPGVAIGDLSSGMFAVIGIMAALMARGHTGNGQYVDVSMFDGLLSWMSIRFGLFFQNGSSARPYDAGYGVFKAGDGKPFTLGIAHENWFWDRLCTAIGLPEYVGIQATERHQRRKELVAELESVFSQKTREKWINILIEADVPVAPVKTPEEVLEDPQVLFREMIQELKGPFGESIRQVAFPVKLSETPALIQSPPPELGEHTEEVLLKAGFTKAEIKKFSHEGAI
ncbi:MAG: CoA transferase [Deltaproteobacteria bacterium]|nr:CoA transferase [Deltaproteobacteria bacterium]